MPYLVNLREKLGNGYCWPLKIRHHLNPWFRNKPLRWHWRRRCYISIILETKKSIFKGQMKGLVVHYFACAICWRIKILQNAGEWFVAATENDRWPRNTEKDNSSTLVQKLLRSKTPFTRLHQFPFFTVGRTRSVFSWPLGTKSFSITKTE